jgi:threonine/homoserine/homoserine lactone efflux protein
MEAVGILAAGMALGLSLAAPPGPVNAVIAVQSVSRSAIKGFMVGLGAMTSDAIFLIITYNLGGLIVINETIRAILSAISCLLMAYLAYITFRSIKNVNSMAGGGKRKAHLPYLTGLSIGLTNPFQIMWWISVGLSLISSIGLVIIAGFFMGIILWISLFPIVMHWATNRIPQLYRIVIYCSSALLVAFSLWFLYNSITLFMK